MKKNIVIITIIALLATVPLVYNYNKGPSTTQPTKNTLKQIIITSEPKKKSNPKKRMSLNNKKAQPKKHIMIFWVRGGSCHKSMLESLTEILEPSYVIHAVNPLDNVLASVDPVRFFSFGKTGFDDHYATMISRNLIDQINFGHPLFLWFMKNQQQKIIQLLTPYIAQENPDLIISTTPFFNYELAQVAKAAGKKFLLIAPDLSIKHYFSSSPENLDVTCTLLFDDAVAWNDAHQLGIKKDQIAGCGMLVRPLFLKKHNKESARKALNIDAHAPVIMIMMGGAGSKHMLNLVKQLSQYPKQLELLVCIGKSANLKKKIEKIRRPPHIKINVIGFTNTIDQIMAASDILITKPGPMSLCEAIEMKLPVLLDQTNKVLAWEKPHIDFVVNHEIGLTISSIRKLNPTLEKFFSDKTIQEKMKKNMEALSNKNFPHTIKSVVDKLMYTSSPL